MSHVGHEEESCKEISTEAQPSAYPPTPQVPGIPSTAQPHIGMRGWSGEEIATGKEGNCWFPLGEVDDSYTYGRRWTPLRVKALENIRVERPIIIANSNLEVKEFPVEINYQLSAGSFQRVTETTPLPVELSYEPTTGGFRRVGANYPLPVTTRHLVGTPARGVFTIAGNNEIVPANAARKIRMHYFSFSNSHAAVVDVALRFGDAGPLIHNHFLAPSGGNVVCNLVDANVEGAVGEALNAVLNAAYAGGVIVNVTYSLV